MGPYTRRVYSDLANYIKKASSGELSARDMNYTKELLNSIQTRLKISGDVAEFSFWMNYYGIQMNKGYSAIDASNRVAEIGFDAYFDDLRDWFIRKKGESGGKAERAAMTTIMKHLDSGHVTSASNKGWFDVIVTTKNVESIIESSSAVLLASFFSDLKNTFPDNIVFL